MHETRELQYVIDVAKRAGEVVLSYYESGAEVREKENHTPVTEADIATEQLIIGLLQKEFSYPIIAEESIPDAARFDSEFVWCIDPIDGTKGFIEKNDQFAVMIGLLKNSEPYSGVVYNPVTDTMYFAEKNRGAYVRRKGSFEKLLAVSDVRKISDMTIAIRSSGNKESEGKIFQELGVHRFVRSGSIGLKTCMVAEALADAVVMTGSGGEWDVCAPQIILEEAGGVVTDGIGEPFLYNKESVITATGYVASNGRAHDKLASCAKKHLKL